MESADIESLLHAFVSTSPPNPAQLSTALTTHLQVDCVPALLRITQTNTNASVRALAITLLRTHQLEFIKYSGTPLATALLELLPREPHLSARRAITALITALQSRFETPFLDLLFTAVAALQSSPNHDLRVEALRLPCPSATTLHKGLTDPMECVRNAALVAYCNATSEPDENIVRLLPFAITAVSHSTTNISCQNLYVPLYEAFTNLIKQPLFDNYFLDASCHTLHTLSNRTLEAATPALEFLIQASQVKPNLILKHLLLDQITDAACSILLTKPSSRTFTHCPVQDDVSRESSTVFLGMRLLESLVQTPQFSDRVFSQAFAKVVHTAHNSNQFDSSALSDCFHIIAALSEGCSEQITSHAEQVLDILLCPQHFDSLNSDQREASLEALQCVTYSLHVHIIPEELTMRIADQCLASVISGIRHPHLSVRKAACLTLIPVIQFCDDVQLAVHGEQIFHAVAMLDVYMALEAVTAIKALAEHTSHALVSSQYFQALLHKTIKIMNPGSSYDTLTITGAFEAAGALVKICEDPGIINEITEHAMKGLMSRDTGIKQATLSFFTFVTNPMRESLLLLHAETVLRGAIELLEQEEIADASRQDYTKRMISLEHTFLQEKITAISCIGCIGTAATGDEFIERLFSLPDTGLSIYHLLGKSVQLLELNESCYQSAMSGPAFRTFCQLATANIRVHELRLHTEAPPFCSLMVIDRVFRKFLKQFNLNENPTVVMDLLDVFAECLPELHLSLVVRLREDIIEGLAALLTWKAHCQTSKEDQNENNNEENGRCENREELEVEIEASQSKGRLMESICNVIEALVRLLRGHFAKYFVCLGQYILNMFDCPSQSNQSRGMMLGTITTVLLFMCWNKCPFPPPCKEDASYELALSSLDNLAAAAIPLALEYTLSESTPTIERNAVFLLGVIFERSRSCNTNVWIQVPKALEALQQIIVDEESRNHALAQRAVGAISRVYTGSGVLPGASENRIWMLEVAFRSLPVDLDPMENAAVVRMFIDAAESDPIGFEESLPAGTSLKVVSCLENAMRMGQVKSAGISRWLSYLNDPDYEMVRLDDWELGNVATLLRRICFVSGESFPDGLEQPGR